MRLTDADFWDEHWNGTRLPVEIAYDTSTPYRKAILRVLDRWTHAAPGRRTLEVGGAPGGYLAYLARKHAIDSHSLDISKVGCDKLRENFRLLDLAVTVHHGDLLSPPPDLRGRFDVVYSLGLIEHFRDPREILARHLDLAHEGGVVIVGFPNLGGVNRAFIRALNPELLTWHELSTMDLRHWAKIDEGLPADLLFRDYVGGWEPRLYVKPGGRRFVNGALSRLARAVDRLAPDRVANSWRWSGYAIAVYRKGPAIVA